MATAMLARRPSEGVKRFVIMVALCAMLVVVLIIGLSWL